MITCPGIAYILAAMLFFAVVAGASLYNVYAASVEDGLFGRVLYSLSAFVSVAGILQLFDGNVTPQTVWTLCGLFACRTVRNAYLHWRIGHYASQVKR